MAVGLFREIERAYCDLRWHLDPVAATQAGIKTYDDRYGRFSRVALAPHLAALKSTGTALEEAPAADLEDEIDRTALLNELRVVLRRFERERPQAKNPAFWLSHLLGGLHFLLGRSDRSAAEKARALAGRLEDVPALLDDARATLVEPVRVFVETALRVNEGGLALVREVGTALPGVAPADAQRLAAAAEGAAAALAGFAHDLERWLESASDQFALGEEDFNFHLHYEHALRDTAPELWRYGLHLKEELELDLPARAKRLDKSKTWQDVADRLRADHPPASALVDAYSGEMARARDFVATHGLVPIPDAPLDVVPTPAFMRPIIPFAAYDPPGAYSPDRSGWFYVTLPDPALPPSTQEALLRARRQCRVRKRDVEPAGAIGRVGTGRVVGRERDDRSHERRCRHHGERGVGDRDQAVRGHEVPRPRHFARVGVHQRARRRMIGAQPVGDVLPGLALVEPFRAGREVQLELFLEVQPVAPELGRRVPQRVLVVQVEVEVLLTQRELIGCALEPALQVVGERGHRRRRRVRRRRDALPQSRGYLPHERQPALVDAQRRFHKHPHRLDQRGSRIVEQPRHVLQPARQRHRALFRGAVAPAQQEVQAAEQVRQPESGVLRLRALALETPQGDPDLVQEGRTVDFSFALVGRGLFEGGCDGFERGEVRSESARAEAPIAVVVGLHSRLRRAHGVQVPSQIEVGPLDLPERRYRHAACLSSRWHSSSDNTRSVRFAASNNARHAASSSGS